MPVYDSKAVDLTDEQHTDAKEVNDLVDAIVDNEGDKAKEALEAAMAVMDDMLDPEERFLHLFKVISGVLSCQIQGRVFGSKP